MFSKNKKNYRTYIFTAVLVALCALIAILLWPTKPVEQVDETPISEPTINQDPEQPTHAEEEEPIFEEEEVDDMSGQESTYYLVKRVDSEIVVFFCHPEGEPVRLETTGILYELLGAEDQKLFDEGVKVDNQEQLSILLQDFES